MTAPLTIGVALPVPEPFGSLLRGARADFGDPMAASVPAHITLTPPTEVDEDGLDLLVAALAKVAATVPPYSIRLQGTGTFRPVSPVVFVAVREGVSQTGDLATSVRSALGTADMAFPFHPHVTVAHHLDDAALDHACAALAAFECEFRVTDFALYLHEADRGWEPRRHFELTGER